MSGRARIFDRVRDVRSPSLRSKYDLERTREIYERMRAHAMSSSSPGSRSLRGKPVRTGG